MGKEELQENMPEQEELGDHRLKVEALAQPGEGVVEHPFGGGGAPGPRLDRLHPAHQAIEHLGKVIGERFIAQSRRSGAVAHGRQPAAEDLRAVCPHEVGERLAGELRRGARVIHNVKKDNDPD